jgi:hypothetical protein
MGTAPGHAQQGITIFSLRPRQAIVVLLLQPGTELSAAVTLRTVRDTCLVSCRLAQLVLRPVQDLDGAILFQDTAAYDNLNLSATLQATHEGARTLGPPQTAKTGSTPGNVYG